MDEVNAIEVNHVSKIYKLFDKPFDKVKEAFSITKKKHYQEFYALKDISFSVKKGETFGIIGTNGSGKSTLLKILTGVVTPNSGDIKVNGKISALMELGAGFNPKYTGMENIYLNGTTMGYTKAEMDKKVDAILEFADIGDFINQPVRSYSSGMFARLAFAVAINVEPEVLIVDEALSVGDVFFQNKCFKKFEELKKKGITILFVSHDMGSVKQMCSRVLWIERGVQQMCGDCVEVCNAYANSLIRKTNIQILDEQIQGEEENQYKIKMLENHSYPPITYSNESILDTDVEIVSCFVEDISKKITTDMYVDEDYLVNVVFKTKRNIDKCIVGFVLETIKGVWIINCNTAICGEENIFSVKAGKTTCVQFKLRMPRLMRGNYVIGCAVSEGTMEAYKVLTWIYNVLNINVINNGNNSGVIDIDTDITILQG